MTKNAGLDILVMPGGHPDRTKMKRRAEDKRTSRAQRDHRRRVLERQHAPPMLEGIHRTGRATAARI